MSKFDRVPSGSNKALDDQVTAFLKRHEEQLSQKTKDDYTTYDPNAGDNQVFERENNQNKAGAPKNVGATAVRALNYEPPRNELDVPKEHTAVSPQPVETPAPYDGQ